MCAVILNWVSAFFLFFFPSTSLAWALTQSTEKALKEKHAHSDGGELTLDPSIQSTIAASLGFVHLFSLEDKLCFHPSAIRMPPPYSNHGHLKVTWIRCGLTPVFRLGVVGTSVEHYCDLYCMNNLTAEFPPSREAASSGNIPKSCRWTRVLYMQALWSPVSPSMQRVTFSQGFCFSFSQKYHSWVVIEFHSI